MIRLWRTLDGAATIIERDYMMTDAEAGSYGEAVVLTNGRLTACGAAAKPEYILLKDTDAGTDVETEYVKVRSDEQEFLIDITGSGTGTAITPGVKACLDSNAMNIDNDVDLSITPGKCLVIKTIDNGNKAVVRFID